MYLLCARHLHLRLSLFFKYTNGRELNKDVFCRHVSIWSNDSTFCTPLTLLILHTLVEKRTTVQCEAKSRLKAVSELGIDTEKSRSEHGQSWSLHNSSLLFFEPDYRYQARRSAMLSRWNKGDPTKKYTSKRDKLLRDYGIYTMPSMHIHHFYHFGMQNDKI